jgi:hypothetical protein
MKCKVTQGGYVPITNDQLVQSDLDWLKSHATSGLLGCLVIHTGSTAERGPVKGFWPDATEWDQVIAARGLAAAQDDHTISGQGWTTNASHNDFVETPKITYDVSVNKAGKMTILGKIGGKAIGGMPATVLQVSVSSTGLVITAIEDNITYTLSFARFVFGFPHST